MVAVIRARAPGTGPAPPPLRSMLLRSLSHCLRVGRLGSSQALVWKVSWRLRDWRDNLACLIGWVAESRRGARGEWVYDLPAARSPSSLNIGCRSF